MYYSFVYFYMYACLLFPSNQYHRLNTLWSVYNNTFKYSFLVQYVVSVFFSPRDRFHLTCLNTLNSNCLVTCLFNAFRCELITACIIISHIILSTVGYSIIFSLSYVHSIIGKDSYPVLRFRPPPHDPYFQ